MSGSSSSTIEQINAALGNLYQIERELGAGGMATVYLARDRKHDRKVAIKVLKPELAAMLGAERFVVEIKTTASLQHPHILPLFDSGEADGFLYYVMPFIQGETIRDKLNRETQFGIDDAIRITREVADALDYAHRHGVIHRDIKPENVMLHDGRAMVMDFGIALALSAAAGGRMTETGLSLGTPHYMSPEQATAEKEITPRSDIYSLASVCYEMLAGQPPHIGGSAQQVIMKIITETARPVNQLRRNVPANVVAALEKALEKVPADRFENAKAFGDALVTGSYSYATTASVGSTGSPTATRRRLVAFAGWATAIVALAIAAFAWLRKPADQPARRFDLSFGNFVLSTAAGGDVVVSPDGSMLAAEGSLGGDRGIFIRHLDGDADFRKVPGAEGGIQPAFSPDNQWLVFRRGRDRSLVKVKVDGGGAMVLVSANDRLDPYFPHWGDDGRIVFSGPHGDGIVSADGGAATPLPNVYGLRPFLLPDGSGMLFGSHDGHVSLYDFKSGAVATFMAGEAPVYLPSGQLLYGSAEGGVFAVPFDLRHHRVTGPPVRVLERVDLLGSARGYSVSRNGLLVHHDADQASLADNQLVVVDPGRGADTVRLPRARYTYPHFSPDGRWVAMGVAHGVVEADISTLDLVTGGLTPLTTRGLVRDPAWSPDGKSIAYAPSIQDSVSGRSGYDLFVRPAGGGAERRITHSFFDAFGSKQWLDDTHLLFAARRATKPSAIYTISIDSVGQPVPYGESPFEQTTPSVSPDRKLIAFESNESGAPELLLRDFPAPQGKWVLSLAPTGLPRWSPDSKAVLFWRGKSPADSLFRVRIDRTPTIAVHDPELVTTLNVSSLLYWDLHPDGRRFIVAVPATNADAKKDATSDRYLIVENWFTELRRLTSQRR